MYTEDDQYDVENKNDEQIKNEQKKFRNMVIIICGVIILLIVLIIVLYLLFSNKKGLALPKATISNSDWTSGNVTVTVDDQNGKIVSYSFDGGKTWSENNAYEAKENETLKIVVKDKKNKISKITEFDVTNIDREGPQISFTDPLYVQKGGTFDYKSGLNVTDAGAGVKEITATPDTIDASIDGEHKVIYKAVDKLGNVTEKERTVIVKNLIIKTWYRARTIGTEKYDCDPYQCKCTSCSTATTSLLYNCPAGYTLSGSRCSKTDVVAKPAECPTGYTLNGTKCEKEEKVEATLGCGSGYYLKDKICYQYKDFTVKNNCYGSYRTSDDGKLCLYQSTATKKTITMPKSGCPEGWSEVQKGVCTLYSDKKTPMYDCSGTGGVIDTSKKMCRTSKIYYCNNSSYPLLSGSYCYDNNKQYKIAANKKCIDGYTADGDYCYRKPKITCPGNSFYMTSTGYCVDPIITVVNSNVVKPEETTYNGYKFSNNQPSYYYDCPAMGTYDSNTGKCMAAFTLVNEKYCPNGYYDNGSGKCVNDQYKEATITCPSGYTKNGSSCVKKLSVAKGACPSGYSLVNNACQKSVTTTASSYCPTGYTKVGSSCKATASSGQCCQTCYKTCTREAYGEWSEWSLTKIAPTNKLQVETKVE